MTGQSADGINRSFIDHPRQSMLGGPDLGQILSAQTRTILPLAHRCFNVVLSFSQPFSFRMIPCTRDRVTRDKSSLKTRAAIENRDYSGTRSSSDCRSYSNINRNFIRIFHTYVGFCRLISFFLSFCFFFAVFELNLNIRE